MTRKFNIGDSVRIKKNYSKQIWYRKGNHKIIDFICTDENFYKLHNLCDKNDWLCEEKLELVKQLFEEFYDKEA